MMRPIEDLSFNQRFRQHLREPFPWRADVFAEIGMMNETLPADLQFASQFAKIRVHDIAICVYERIKTEDKID